MNHDKTTRKSHCSICGKRLSEKTDAGSIRWRPGGIDDAGMRCESCSTPKKSTNGR